MSVKAFVSKENQRDLRRRKKKKEKKKRKNSRGVEEAETKENVMGLEV